MRPIIKTNTNHTECFNTTLSGSIECIKNIHATLTKNNLSNIAQFILI